MLNTSRTIARVETRRAIRVLVDDRVKLLLNVGVMLLAVGPIVLVGVLLLPEAGAAVAAGEFGGLRPTSIVESITGVVAVIWLLSIVFGTARTVTTVATVDQPACVLVSSRVRTVVAGLLGAELLKIALWLGPPVLLLSGAFASGYGSPVPVLAMLAVLAILLGTAIPAGFVVGIWIRHLLSVYEPIARYRTLVLVGIGVGYVGAIAMGWFDAFLELAFAVLSGSPVGWPGHLLLVSVPGIAPSPRALVATAVGAVTLLAVSLKLGTISAQIHWFADPARTEDAVETESGDWLGDVLSVGIPARIRAVTVTAIRRTTRRPIRLVYVAYPLFGGLFFVDEIVSAGTIPPSGAVALFAYVIWGSGALFTLNPLGDAGQALPAVVTSTITGRELMAGRTLAGALVAVPVALLVGVVVILASPLAPGTTAALTAGAATGGVLAPALGTGVGTAFPRFGSVRVTNNREAVMPSKTAFVVYTLVLALPGGAATVLYTDASNTVASIAGAFVSLLPGVTVTIPTAAVVGPAWLTLLAGLAAPVASFRYASRTFDRYTID